MTVLEVRDLRVRYAQRGGAFVAVDGVSFTLTAGRTVALVGESGSGKTTVVRALGQLVRPSGGQVLLDGAPVGRRGRALRAYRRRVQLVFQDPFASLNPLHTVRYHLRRPLQLRPDRPRGADLDRRVHELLAAVNLTPPEDIARSFPHELSGGQRQRVAIARVLATGPEVLLADEPVSMLDVSIRLEILNLLDELKRSRDLALLYVTHDLATARYFAAEILVMYRGEIVERGPSDEVILHPAHPYTEILAAAAPDPDLPRAQRVEARRARLAARAARDAERREAELDAGCRFRSRCPYAMPVCSRRPPEIEVRPGHAARCWRHDRGPGGAAG